MRPFAFLEPRAFFNTDPDFRAQIELNECVGLIASIFFGGSVGGLNPPYYYCSTLGRTLFRLARAYSSNRIDAHRAARRKGAGEKRHRRKPNHNHDGRETSI